MNTPILAIDGSHDELNRYLRTAAQNKGFLLEEPFGSRDSRRVEIPGVLKIWVTRQIQKSYVAVHSDVMSSVSRLSEFELHANVVLFCTDNLGELTLQMSYLLTEIRSGELSANQCAQVWRGFTMPQLPPDRLTGYFAPKVLSA